VTRGRSRGLWSVLALVGAIAGVLPVAAQDATPTLPADGVLIVPLIRARVEQLPAAPAAALLGRFSLAAGGEVATQMLDGPLVLFSESGSVTVQVEGPAALSPASSIGTPAATSPVTAGEPLTLAQGDVLTVPDGTGHALRIDGSEAVSVIGVAVLPGEIRSPLPGMELTLLSAGVANGLPAGPDDVAMSRVTYGAGATRPKHGHPGPELLHVESGQLSLVVDTGEATYRPASSGDVIPTALTGPAMVAPIGEGVPLAAGSSLFVQPGLVGIAPNDATGNTVFVLCTIFPVAGGAPATPVALDGGQISG